MHSAYKNNIVGTSKHNLTINHFFTPLNSYYATNYNLKQRTCISCNKCLIVDRSYTIESRLQV